MEARQLLQGLKDQIQVQSQLQEDEIICTPISGPAKDAEIMVMVPIEGVTRMILVRAREVGVYEGL